jgi:isopenicillin-N N-acyltransferase-like protein
MAEAGLADKSARSSRSRSRRSAWPCRNTQRSAGTPSLRAAATARTLDDFGVLLADHADYPHSICAHPDPAAHPCEQGATIASVLMDLTARRIRLAAGNPCQVPFEQLDIAL